MGLGGSVPFWFWFCLMFLLFSLFRANNTSREIPFVLFLFETNLSRSVASGSRTLAFSLQDYHQLSPKDYVADFVFYLINFIPLPLGLNLPRYIDQTFTFFKGRTTKNVRWTVFVFLTSGLGNQGKQIICLTQISLD